MTDSILEFLSAHHRDCDEELVATESAVGAGAWDAALPVWRGFIDNLERHFLVEEEVLFPAIEGRTGASCGPTEMMRSEHEQMRALARGMEADLVARDRAFLGRCETMMVFVQQHNMREEQVLYPMADELLDDVTSLVLEMRDRLADPLERPT